MKKTRILSIDGGGIRGVIPGTILAELEKKIQEKTNNSNARLSDFFDLIAGTSTGGILTCLYLLPDENGNPKYSAQEAVDLYFKKGGDIFKTSIFDKIKSLGDEKYDAEELENALHNYMLNNSLKNLIKPCAITAYDIEKRQVLIFNSIDAENPTYNFRVKDIARATAAAPTYFEPASITNDVGEYYCLVDGGVFASNPAMCAYSEARNIDFSKTASAQHVDKPFAKDMIIVSIGTGTIEKPYPYEKMKNKGQIGWIKPVIDIMMSSTADTVDYHLKQIYDTLEGEDKNHYFRLEPHLIMAKPEMDDASDKNLNNLKNDALEFAKKHEATLNNIVDLLIKNHTEEVSVVV